MVVTVWPGALPAGRAPDPRGPGRGLWASPSGLSLGASSGPPWQAMAASAPHTARPSTAQPPTKRRNDARQFRRAAWLIFGVVAVLLVLVTVTASLSPPSKAQRKQAHRDAVSNPQSVAPPDYGQAPKQRGDPGGWEQLALGGLLFVAVAGGGLWLVHLSRKARRTAPPGEVRSA